MMMINETHAMYGFGDILKQVLPTKWGVLTLYMLLVANLVNIKW